MKKLLIVLFALVVPATYAATKSKANPMPAIGDTMAIKFQAVDSTQVDLAMMKGKVVLVDFWATWCGPCVRELPNVKAAYDKYHSKGFEVIGISLDDSKADLKKFIQREKIAWPQSCSGAGWDDKIAKQFGIKSIPSMFLIGKDGKVVETDLRGPGVLETKLEELLK